MCSVDIVSLQSIHIVQNPKGMEFSQFFSNHWQQLVIFLAVILILILWTAKSYPQFQKYNYMIKIMMTVLIITTVLFVGFVFSTRFSSSCGNIDLNYYTDKEFVEKMADSSQISERVMFFPQGKISLKNSNYTFNCYNKECARMLSISDDNKTLLSLNTSTGYIFNCDSQNTLNIVIFDKSRRFNLTSQECSNSRIFSDMKEEILR